MTIYTLYIKTHNKTGLKYLGYTKKDPIKYKGSGTYWLRHIAKYGYDVTTSIVVQSSDKSLIQCEGIRLSKQFNVVESEEWANLMIESTTGGDNSQNIDYARIQQTRIKNGIKWNQTEDIKDKHRSIMQSYWDSERAESRKSKPFVGPPKPRSHLQNNSSSVSCQHCGHVGNLGNMRRWHLDRCKSNPNRLTDKDAKPVTCYCCGFVATQSPNFYRNHGSNCKSRPQSVIVFPK